MARIDTFTLRVNSDERRILANLAQRLERSQSDAVRLLIREAARELGRGGDGVPLPHVQPVQQQREAVA